LQIGVAFAPTSRSDAQTEPTRLPAAISAYSQGTTFNDGNSFGTALLKRSRKDSVAVIDFRLDSNVSSSYHVELANFQLKPTRSSTIASASTGVAAILDGMQYTVEWTAFTAASYTSGPKCPSSGSWSLVPNEGSQQQWHHSIGRDASEVASMQLQALQMQIEDPASHLKKCITLQTAGPPSVMTLACHSVYRSGGSSAACAWALLHVVAQENADVLCRSYGLDVSVDKIMPALPESDSFGSLTSGGLWFVPQLRKCMNRLPPSPALDANMYSTVLVTGGLGDIGLLVGFWVAVTWPGTRVVLLSRNGSSRRLSLCMSNISAPITAVRCDASSLCELTSLASDLQASDAPPIKAIFHAGGVIQVLSCPMPN